MTSNTTIGDLYKRPIPVLEQNYYDMSFHEKLQVVLQGRYNEVQMTAVKRVNLNTDVRRLQEATYKKVNSPVQ